MKTYIHFINRLFSLCFALGLTLCSCNAPKRKELTPLKDLKNDIIVLNEGGFEHNNAEISIYNQDSGTVVNEVFRQRNHKSMGDVLQSVAWHDHKFYWIMNNSQKILITDSNYVHINTITGMRSPRYMYFVDQNKAYVSDLFGHQIAVVDLQTLQVLRSIPCKGWTEKFIKEDHSTDVWVSNRYTDKIYKINTATDVITDSITTVYAPCDLVYDKHGRLWVSCSGKSEDNIPGALLCIDLKSKQVLKKLEAPAGHNFGDGRLCVDASKSYLLWIDGGIKRVHIDA
ncbi:MAG TPA: DUF5074 domain-containing protein, partial [Cytophagales bacterium]|nr:DUF5074 domain-containing protein [Cytophagales bacterium]